MDTVDVMSKAFSDELQKIAAAKEDAVRKAGKGALRKAAPYVGAVVGYETLRRANRDRQMGRAMRIQQGAY
jgi:hypothetical protein